MLHIQDTPSIEIEKLIEKINLIHFMKANDCMTDAFDSILFKK